MAIQQKLTQHGISTILPSDKLNRKEAVLTVNKLHSVRGSCGVTRGNFLEHQCFNNMSDKKDEP